MLKSLLVQNYALIQEVHVEFSPGMTVLLGETGAGKSILVDALGAALGARTSPNVVRHGTKKAVVEARFDASTSTPCSQILARHDLCWDDEDLLVRREINLNGTSRCFVNDVPVQASTLRELSSLLIDFHGQHDTHGLLSPSRHREIFDDLCQLQQNTENMARAFEEWKSCRVQLDVFHQRQATAAEERHRCERIIRDVSAVNPLSNEDTTVAIELERAESAEYILDRVQLVRNTLANGDHSVQNALNTACAAIDELVVLAPSLQPFASELRAAIVVCNETSSELLRLADPEAFSPERIESLRHRWLELQRLIKNYGSLEQALLQERQARKAIEELDSTNGDLERLTTQERQAHAMAVECAITLTQLRKQAIPQIESEIEAVLHRMGMRHCRFCVHMNESDLSAQGCDDVSFHVATNSGSEPQGLHKVASGGELSRVMLALKRLSSARRGVGTLVLDEIDAGISGRVARSVGLIMEEIALTSQIICITHLPQIASIADSFVKVSKLDDGESSSVTANAMAMGDAEREIAALVSGDHVTDAAIQSARELMIKHTART
jgi:DNA repair protein RecN (Recombination protein N)